MFVALLGTWWFWIAVTSFILLLTLEALESRMWSTVTIIATVLGLQFLADIDIYGYIIEDPWRLAKVMGGYFAFGTFYSIVKWWVYIIDSRTKFREDKAKFFSKHNLKDNVIPVKLKEEWRRSMGYKSTTVPRVSDHKGRIIGWIVYWPANLVWTLISDVVRRIGRFIYSYIHNLLQAMADKAFKNDWVEFKENPVPPEGSTSVVERK